MKHQPVMPEEIVDALKPHKDGIYLDGTVGYGGHAEALLKAGAGKLIGLDRDEKALESTGKRLKKYKNVILQQGSYWDARDILIAHDIDLVDGIVLDLGASSPQFDDPQRGFSIKEDGPLDMRFDLSSRKTAAEILNMYPQSKLAAILRDYGEERYANKIAKAIVALRRDQKLVGTTQLRELIENTIPRRFWPKNIHPATRTFQALRIEVNDELQGLKKALPELISLLKSGGRIVVISFHSLEDRIVKQAFRLGAQKCLCPKEFPVCRCDKEVSLKIITKKPVIPTKKEIKTNVRARSAKLRIAERL